MKTIGFNGQLDVLCLWLFAIRTARKCIKLDIKLLNISLKLPVSLSNAMSKFVAKLIWFDYYHQDEKNILIDKDTCW